MQIIRILAVLSVLGMTLGGCAVIRGAASGAPGDAWYVRASTFNGKIKNVHYCPQEGTSCYKASFVSAKELALTATQPSSGGEN